MRGRRSRQSANAVPAFYQRYDAAARVLMVLGDGISLRRTADPGFDPEKVLPLVLQMIGCLLGHPERREGTP